MVFLHEGLPAEELVWVTCSHFSPQQKSVFLLRRKWGNWFEDSTFKHFTPQIEA